MDDGLSERRERFDDYRRTQRALARKNRNYVRIVAEKVASKRPTDEAILVRAITSACIKARANARKRKIDYDVETKAVLALARQEGYKCAITGLPFTLESTPGWFRRPFAPSLDRKESAKGYTETNVRVVCCAVNYALGEWGQTVFDAVARAYVQHQDR